MENINLSITIQEAFYSCTQGYWKDNQNRFDHWQQQQVATDW